MVIGYGASIANILLCWAFPSVSHFAMEFVWISDCDLFIYFCYFSHLFLAYVSLQLDSSSFSNGWVFSLLGIIYFLFSFLGFSLSLLFISCVLTTLCQCVTSTWPCLLSHGCCSSLFLFSKVLPHLGWYWIHFHPFCIPGVRGFGQALQPLTQRLKKAGVGVGSRRWGWIKDLIWAWGRSWEVPVSVSRDLKGEMPGFTVLVWQGELNSLPVFSPCCLGTPKHAKTGLECCILIPSEWWWCDKHHICSFCFAQTGNSAKT